MKYLSRRFLSNGYRLANVAKRNPILLIPQEDRYVFESEKLTPEENRAAIPPRPTFEDCPKYHYEILSPEFIADLILKPSFKDVFLTSLCKNSAFPGYANYVLTPKDRSKNSEPVNLYFTSIVTKWVEVFNEKVYSLRNLPELEDSLPSSNRLTKDIIDKGLKEFQETRGENVPKNLDEYYVFLKLFEKNYSSSNFNKGSPRITAVTLSSVLIDKAICNGSPSDFEKFIEFLENNIEEFSYHTSKQLLRSLISNLHESDNTALSTKFGRFKDFMDSSILGIYPSMIMDLSPLLIDKLVYLNTVSANVEGASSMLKILVEEYKCAPSKLTLASYLDLYTRTTNKANNETLQSAKDRIVRDLEYLKPVFFLKDVHKSSYKILLDSVANVYDLEQFVNLLLSKKNRDLIITFTPLILKRLVLLNSLENDSDFCKSLRLSQLFRRLLVENDMKLDDKMALTLKDQFFQYGETSIKNFFTS